MKDWVCRWRVCHLFFAACFLFLCFVCSEPGSTLHVTAEIVLHLPFLPSQSSRGRQKHFSPFSPLSYSVNGGPKKGRQRPQSKKAKRALSRLGGPSGEQLSRALYTSLGLPSFLPRVCISEGKRVSREGNKAEERRERKNKVILFTSRSSPFSFLPSLCSWGTLNTFIIRYVYSKVFVRYEFLFFHVYWLYSS